MSELTMPSFGADMEAGTLVRWQVRPGQRIARGDIVAVIETMKGAIDMEAFEDGRVEALLVREGDSVPVGTPIAAIRPDRDTDAVAEPESQATPPEPEAPPVYRPPPPVEPPPPPQVGGRIRASPLARRLARERQLDLAGLGGSGPDGALVRDDIERALAGHRPDTAPAPDAMRQAIAAAMSRSKREIPHYYLETTLDLSSALDWLERYNGRRDPEARILPAALLLKASALALRRYPALNGYYRDGAFVAADAVHLGTAIYLRGGGLVVPALLDADRMSLQQLMQRLRDLTERARKGGLRSSEMSQATVTVTSLGERGVETVYGVIFPPQVAILGFGSPVRRPWVTAEGRIEVRPLVRVTLAADHRVSDGHLGARFLRDLEKRLQTPDNL